MKMKYELSNTIFKRKPTDGTMKKKYPFTRHKEMVKLILDEPRNLYEAYKEGLTFKPHPFTEDNLENAKVNCIVLDFDHLTKKQCDFLANICYARRFHPTPMYGDYSAGTKVRLYENQDIPNYENPKWGYKVFYPVNCLCVWSELNEAFLDAVIYFNPQHSKEQAKEVWAKWLKANNNKEKVKNPIFNNWILPDVAMLNSYRTQVTYGVRPNQKEEYEKVEDDDRMEGKFPCGGIKDYSGLEWKPEEIAKDTEPDDKLVENWTDKVLMDNLNLAIQLAIQNPNEREYLTLTIPTSKSMLARRLKKAKFDDLTWDDKANAILNARMYSKEIAIGKAREVSMDAARTLTRNLIEMELQRNLSFTIQDIIKNHAGLLMKDIVATTRQRCGLNVFIYKKMEGGNSKDQFTEQDKKLVARTIVKAASNYTKFKARMKLRNLEQETRPHHLDLLEEYARTKDPETKAAYNRERNEWRRSMVKHALEQTKTPYTYHKKGLKSWLIHVACVDLPIEELEEWGFEPTKLKDKEEWMVWCRNALNHKEGDLNDVTDEELERWFRFYRQEYNKKFGKLEGKVKKGRKSKYDDLFKDMTKEQIADYIKNSDLHRQMKKKLKEKYL